MGVIACYGDIRKGRKVSVFTNPANVAHFTALLGADPEVTIVADRFVPRLSDPLPPEEPEPFAVAAPSNGFELVDGPPGVKILQVKPP